MGDKARLTLLGWTLQITGFAVGLGADTIFGFPLSFGLNEAHPEWLNWVIGPVYLCAGFVMVELANFVKDDNDD